MGTSQWCCHAPSVTPGWAQTRQARNWAGMAFRPACSPHQLAVQACTVPAHAPHTSRPCWRQLRPMTGRTRHEAASRGVPSWAGGAGMGPPAAQPHGASVEESGTPGLARGGAEGTAARHRGRGLWLESLGGGGMRAAKQATGGQDTAWATLLSFATCSGGVGSEAGKTMSFPHSHFGAPTPPA